MLDNVAAWINRTLIGPDGYFAPNGFEFTLPLYHSPLHGSFLLSVIDGSAQPATFSVPSGRSPYNEPIRTVRHVSEDDPAFWFYGTNPDNALSLLSWVHRCHYDHALDYRLESFETEPAAEGGCSWLGLASASRKWLLLHEYSPSNSFDISVHGTLGFCQAVAAGVGLLPSTSHPR